jgi:cytochrome c peroxidase
LFRIKGTLSPAFRRRPFLRTVTSRALAVPRAAVARRRALSICLGLLLASGVALQAAPESRPSCATPLPEEPITPIPPPPVADSRKLELGERLFSDTRLSAGGNLSCSSCHDLRANGASGGRAKADQGTPNTRFNTLSVFNAALNFRLNWEGNFRSLADQVEASLENPANLNTNASDVAARLNNDPAMVERFRAAYEHLPDRESLLDALVTFERSLVTPGSRFDRWLGGNMSALSEQEQDGYRLFKSLGCAACHQGVNVGGNLMERQGIFRQLVPGKPTIVRVPSLRNVATTSPYFHDGSAPTLQDAIRRMAGAQLDRTLSDQQVESLVAFLKTLTGTYQGVPVSEAQP